MSHPYVNLETLRFLLHEVHDVAAISQSPYYEAYQPEACDMVLDAIKQLGDTYLFPFHEAMDRQEPEINEQGKLHVHESVIPFMQAMAEGGWLGAVAPESDGGMQMPLLLGSCVSFILSAANNSSTVFSGLTVGAANLLMAFGTAEQKERYLTPMMESRWQGTMALTEPQAGSSLSDITSKATPMPDGSYRIQGQKIYISAGDYEGVENVVHMLLARIEGAPAGTKGISLFIVPKKRITESGALADNDVSLAGVYHKLGQKGTPATHLMYGEKNDCHGYLVGEANKGLNYMFQMMNEARIAVGIGGAAIASAAYHASLQFAKERPQGRSLGQRDLTQPQVPIIEHPDVKRMLLLQKALFEGGFSLVMECARYSDLAKISAPEEQEKYEMLLDLLTPVAKTFPAEMGIVSVSNGLQILGGGGYCTDFSLEKYYRDIRIYTIYEGTTGIQSLDLLGRKVVMKGGKAAMYLFQAMQATCDAAKEFEALGKYVGLLQTAMQQHQAVTLHLIGFAQKGEIEKFLADANLYMELSGIVLVAWQWLKQGLAAAQALASDAPMQEKSFYETQLHTMKFYFAYEVPKIHGLHARLMDGEPLTLAENEIVF